MARSVPGVGLVESPDRWTYPSSGSYGADLADPNRADSLLPWTRVYVEVQGRDTLIDSQRCILTPAGHDGPCKRSLQEPAQSPGQAQAAMIDRPNSYPYWEGTQSRPGGA